MSELVEVASYRGSSHSSRRYPWDRSAYLRDPDGRLAEPAQA